MSSKQKIANIKKQIADAKSLFETLSEGRGVKLLAHIRRLELLLKIEEGHVISKLNSQRSRLLPGSFGASRNK